MGAGWGSTNLAVHVWLVGLLARACAVCRATAHQAQGASMEVDKYRKARYRIPRTCQRGPGTWGAESWTTADHQ